MDLGNTIVAAALVRAMMEAILQNRAGPREILRACIELTNIAHVIVAEDGCGEQRAPRQLN